MPEGFWSLHLEGIGGGLIAVVLYSLLGIAVVFVAVRFWDRVTPGNLEQEVFIKGNIAAAIFGAALVLGLSWIVAAAIRG
jgi:uncharacterized membrane protein YjfL (UPF0719 family)